MSKLGSQPTEPYNIDKAIQVTQIPPELLKKYRTVGIKDGRKQFMIKTPKGSPVSKSKKKNPPLEGKGEKKNPKNLSFKNLQAKVKESDLPPDPQIQKKNFKNSEFKEVQKTALKKEIKAAENGVPLTSLRSSQAIENFKRQEIMRRDLSKSLGTQSQDAEILGRAGFNLHFEPPEGVSEDELNSVEKIFYSFQKRTFVSYVNSFLSTYQQALLNKPQIKSSLRNDRHLLTGKIDFDRQGNILRIKILRSSHDDDVHELFEKTLREIRTLPNPPKALIEKRDQFTIYYQLSVNY
ncbi:MAG: TonB C-terminal domain-containing protein [Halobacteriovoraceae bacterium]|nr:TonB C-terminal domain-containing protein [Halobacteriovoraceae bacterium]